MFSKPIQQLIDLFMKFPGVGPRQAGRFVFYLLREDKSRVQALAEAVAKLHDEVKFCTQCYKTFDANPHTHSGIGSRRFPQKSELLSYSSISNDVQNSVGNNPTMSVGANHAGAAAGGLCEFCRDSRRNQRQILVAEKEADLENIERTKKYQGLYHVLGGTINPLDSSAPSRLHIKELFGRIQKLADGGPPAGGETEIILATNPTAEGDATAMYLERVLNPLKNQYPALKISRLGRGLGTGSELEYSDEITIANALQNRK